MKIFQIIQTSQRLPILAVAIVLCSAAVFSQNALPTSPERETKQASSARATPSQASPSPSPDKTRPRRVPAGSKAEDTGTASVPTATESPLPNSSDATASEPKSEMMALRDEIEASANARERTRLQLKLADYLVSSGMKQQAIAELHAMSDEERFDPQGFYNIANALARLGETDKAISTYRKAIEQRKGRYSRASNNLGVILMRQGFWDEAYESFMSALRIESFRYAEASYNLGRLYAARGEGDLAFREWRRAVAVDPEHKLAAQALASASTAENITVAATRPGIRSVSNTTPSGGTRAAEDERRSARSEKPAMRPIGPAARRSLGSSGASQVFTVEPETYRFLQRARASLERGRQEEAIENYRKVISRMGGYFPPANLELGYALLALKRNQEALAILLPVSVKDGTRFPITYYHLARLYEAGGDLKLAEESFMRAAEFYREGNVQFLLDLSRVREKLGNFAGALASMEQFITTLERQGLRPAWSDERLTALRQKLAASQPK